MGRRPNAIVGVFFERGSKLNDASNRYSQRCKRCGEVFPKGRVDSLMSHVIRKCVNVSSQERDYVFQAIQQNGQSPQVVRGSGSGGSSRNEQFQSAVPSPIQQQSLNSRTIDTIVDGRTQQASSQDGNVSLVLFDTPSLLHQQREPSALDTLAEVSRRHLDYSEHRTTKPAVDERFTDTDRQGIAENSVVDRLQHSDETRITKTAVEPSIHGDAEGVRPPNYPTLTSAVVPSPLVETAFAATRALEHGTTHQPDPKTALDPQLADIEARLHTELSAAAEAGVQSQAELEGASWASVKAPTSLDFNPTPQPHGVTPHYGIIPRPANSRARTRFTDSRREEVFQIRKRGACMRCRMLKKPCSEGTPCSTCLSVESARLWRGSCIRTKLVDEFTLWSTGLFHSKAKIEVPAAVHGLLHNALGGSIQARFFSMSTLCMTFSVRRYSHPPTTAMTDSQDQGTFTSDDILLLDEGEGMSTKVEEYANQVADAIINAEPSLFLRTTLQHAHAVTHNDGPQDRATLDSDPSRSCYSFQSQLLKNVVELWVETNTLALRKSGEVHISYNPDNVSTQQRNGAAAIIEPHSLSPRSQELIYAQLLAVTESRCLALSKTVMNELERRLLQRQQVSGFATYLSAVILLNCVERMTGAYRAFDHGPSIGTHLDNDLDPAPATVDETELSLPSTPLPDWPLDDSPSKLWRQGEPFADLLIMLLRMRALPPKLLQTSEGTAYVDQDHGVPVRLNGRPVRQQIQDQTSLPAAWLDPMNLTISDLVRARDRPLPGQGDDATSWDMKFISRLLLPEQRR